MIEVLKGASKKCHRVGARVIPAPSGGGGGGGWHPHWYTVASTGIHKHPYLLAFTSIHAVTYYISIHRARVRFEF